VEVRRALSAVCLLSLITLQVLLMLRYNHLQAHAEEYFGRAWYTPYAPSVLYFAVCNLGGAVFYPISAQLNEFEMHPTKVEQSTQYVYYPSNAAYWRIFSRCCIGLLDIFC
jgi:hypothetical protein